MATLVRLQSYLYIQILLLLLLLDSGSNFQFSWRTHCRLTLETWMWISTPF